MPSPKPRNVTISDAMGYLGVGLPVDGRALEGYQRLTAAMHRSPTFAKALINLPGDKRNQAYIRLERLAHEYWSLADYDARHTFLDMRGEISAIIPVVEKLLELLEVPSPSTRFAISRELTGRLEFKDGVADKFKPIVAANEQLLKACNLLMEKEPTSRARKALVQACRRLWAEWEQVTGLPFKRKRWEGDKGDRSSLEFIEPDAHFVQLATQAFDPEVTWQNVRSALTVIVKEKTVKPTSLHKG